MQKRGQITIFIVVGIFIVATIILVAVLKGGTIKNAIESQLGTSTSFKDEVNNVEVIVQDCLDRSMMKTFTDIAIVKSKDYQGDFAKVLETSMIGCLNFSDVKADVVYGAALSQNDLGDFSIAYSADKNIIKAIAKMDIAISDGKNTGRLNEFYSELNIIPNCCIPAQVDGSCAVEEAVKTVSCGRIYDLKIGDSLKARGACLAC